MRLIFAGTPVFAQAALAALAQAGHEIVLVLTRPDQPSGRGQRLQASPVKELALQLGLPVYQPRTLRDPAAREQIAQADADAMVVAAYGLILPADVLALPRLGCINIHASLLPRWRGAAPIQRAVQAGDPETGITIMRMDEGLDTGPMLLQRAIPIGADESGGSVHDRLQSLGARMIVEALAGLQAGALAEQPQPAAGATYASKLLKTEMQLDWRLGARELADRVRAFDPFPGSAIRLAGRPDAIKLWRASVAGATEGAGPQGAGPAGDDGVGGAVPGEVLLAHAGALIVACGDGALSLLEVQRPGGRRLPVGEFLRAFPVRAGDRFECPCAQ